MAGLLYKELVLNKKMLACIALCELVLSAMFVMPIIYDNGADDTGMLIGLMGVIVFFIMFLMLGAAVSGFFETDESKKWAYFISSSPVTHIGQIRTKYIFTLLLYFTLLAWCELMSSFLALFDGTVNVYIAIFSMCIMMLANAVEYPFIVRFGSKFGNYIKTAIGTAVVLIVFEYALFGNTSIFSDSDSFFEFIEGLTDTAKMSDISLVLLAGFPYLSAGIYFLSYKISCKLYLKGAEEYDR